MPKTYEFATLDSVLDAFNEGRRVRLADVRPSLRDAQVWQAFYGMSGGYMPDDSSRYFARNLRAVVEYLCDAVRHHDDSDRAPAGFRRGLMQGGGSEYGRDGNTVYEAVPMTVREICNG